MIFYKITQFPPQVKNEPWSETVIGYDSDLDYADFQATLNLFQRGQSLMEANVNQ